MKRSRRLSFLVLGAAASALSLGLVAAQELSGPPLPPGYVPGVGYAPAPGDPPRAADGPAAITLPEAPPPEEAAPPPEVVEEADAEAELLEPPEVEKAEPMKRPRFSSAILQAVDKVTAQTLRFEAKVGEPVRFKGMVLTVHACEATASDEGFADSIAHLDVQAQPEALTRQPSRVVYRGWMFAASPSLHPVEHPLYDVWLIACKTAVPAAVGASL